MRRYLLGLVFLFTLAPMAHGETHVFNFEIKAGKQEYQNCPVTVPITLPKKIDVHTNVTLTGDLGQISGQLTPPSLTTNNIKPLPASGVRYDVHFIVPKLKPLSSAKLVCTIDTEKRLLGQPAFSWNTSDPNYEELYFRSGSQSTPVLRYMKRPYDPSSPETRDKSYKVFHHVYDPAGSRFVTNGGHTDDHADAKKLVFPHHRGLMYGFNRVTFGKNKKADTWHCRKDDHVSHVKTLETIAGPVLGRHRVELSWHGPKNEHFATELREMTVYKVPGGTLIEFASKLETTGGLVKLDGDPQHAGFQFRAANQVAVKTKSKTYYIRPGTGKGKMGATVNWPQNKDATVDLEWKGMSFVLDDDRFTVAYLDHPKNPGEARHSERDYGRFGYYFTYELTKDNPLLVNYRIWLQEGEMTTAEIANLREEFVMPPIVTVTND